MGTEGGTRCTHESHGKLCDDILPSEQAQQFTEGTTQTRLYTRPGRKPNSVQDERVDDCVSATLLGVSSIRQDTHALSIEL